MFMLILSIWDFPCGSVVKNLPAMQETQVQSLGQEDPLDGAWQPSPVFLPGEFHGQRNLVGYGPCSCKESDTAEVTEQPLTYIYLYGGNTVDGVLLPTSFQLCILWCQVKNHNLEFNPPMKPVVKHLPAHHCSKPTKSCLIIY